MMLWKDRTDRSVLLLLRPSHPAIYYKVTPSELPLWGPGFISHHAHLLHYVQPHWPLVLCCHMLPFPPTGRQGLEVLLAALSPNHPVTALCHLPGFNSGVPSMGSGQSHPALTAVPNRSLCHAPVPACWPLASPTLLQTSGEGLGLAHTPSPWPPSCLSLGRHLITPSCFLTLTGQPCVGQGD